MAGKLQSLGSFVYSQLFVTPVYPTTSCVGKTVCITGSNVGLGKEAARHFVRLGADKVIIACRSTDKGEAAKKDIETTEKKQGVIEVWQLDLGSYQSVKEFAKRIDGLNRLDIMIENAGIATGKFKTIEDDEATITTNVVSTFLLALLIMPTLKRMATQYNFTPTLSITSSEVHYWTDFPERHAANIFEHLSDEKEARMGDRYLVSKLMEVMIVRELAAQHPQPPYPVTINCLNPGLCYSELARENKDAILFTLMQSLLSRTTEVGSRTLVNAGLSGQETHGQYLSDCKVRTPSALVMSPEGDKAQKQVWKELSQKLEKIQPGILGNL